MDLEEVIDRAIEFLERKAGYFIHKLLRAEFKEDEGKWYLEFDVGAITVKKVKIVIDDRSGKIVAYEGPS